MNYVVIKNTTEVIDDSNNPIETMLLNAQNAGFTEANIEILTEEQYQERLENEPKPPQPPSTEEKLRADIDYIAIMTGVDISV